MRSLFKLGGVFLVFLLARAAIASEKEVISEASGVCRLGDSLIIAGDENPNSFWVVDDPSAMVKRVAVTNRQWNDMEELSSVDSNRFFAITSHSRTKQGKRKPEREQLLLIRAIPPFAAIYSWTLREKILTALENFVGDSLDIHAIKEALPDRGGLNLEGLAYHHDELFLGLRSPLTNREEALILRITNAKGMLTGELPRIDEVIALPLNGRGIRGMTSYAGGLVIIAGSPNDKEEAFSVYQWYESSRKSIPLTLSGFSKLTRPEAVVAEPNGTLTFVQDLEEAGKQDVIVNLPAPTIR